LSGQQFPDLFLFNFVQMIRQQYPMLLGPLPEALFGLMAGSILFVSAPEKATPHNSMMEGLRILRL
jgi:hypothetical protein